jgi:hypothetical protein
VARCSELRQDDPFVMTRTEMNDDGRIVERDPSAGTRAETRLS